MRCYLNIEVILLNSVFDNNINFNMEKEMINKDNKKDVFKKLIIDYLIKNIVGNNHVN